MDPTKKESTELSVKVKNGKDLAQLFGDSNHISSKSILNIRVPLKQVHIIIITKVLILSNKVRKIYVFNSKTVKLIN